MKMRKVAKGLYYIKFKTSQEMCRIVMRFQEHYESPGFRGKIFTRKEYSEWYRKTYGKFSYYNDWDGFNIPDYCFDAFNRGLFDPLTKEEAQFLALVNTIRDKKFYIITSAKNSDKSVFKHEMGHGLYYLNFKYRWLSRFWLLTLGPKLLTIFRYLKTHKYYWTVYLDEAHAYLMADLKSLDDDGDLEYKQYEFVHNRLNALYKRYMQ